MAKKVKKIIFLIFLILPVFSYCQDKITVIVFSSPHCKACFKVKEEILPEIKERYKDKVEWRRLDTSQPDNLKLLLALMAQSEKKWWAVPAISVGDIVLIGAKSIGQRLESKIEKLLEKKIASQDPSGKRIENGIENPLEKGIVPHDLPKTGLSEAFKKLSVFAVIGGGLIDGINPCAFAVIVFFISFLAVYGYKKREVIYVGIFYCLAVFTAYLLIGLGIFNFFYSLAGIYLFIKLFYYFIAFFCFLMGILALYDYFRFKKTGESKEAILQLPKFLKKKINIVIGSRMRRKKQNGVFSLIITSFTVGFLVSLLEAVCTGQVYMPTIVFILKNTNLRLKAVTWLILYNVMFTLPLIAVFLLSFAGVSSLKFNNFLKRNLGRIKILMALVFFLLGIVILCLG